MRKAVLIFSLMLCAGLSLMAAPAQGCRVLVAGDVRWDPEIGRHLEALGVREGMAFRLERAEDLSAALLSLGTERFDAIVLSRTMLEEAPAAQVRKLLRRARGPGCCCTRTGRMP
jgi:hypothetical protein